MPKSFSFKLVIKGIIVSSIIGVILSLIYGLLITFTSLSESDLAITIIFSLCIFIGAFWITNQAGTKGLYYGITIGIGFTIFLIVLSNIFSPTTPTWIRIGEKVLLGILAGGLGGISGVIFKK